MTWEEIQAILEAFIESLQDLLSWGLVGIFLAIIILIFILALIFRRSIPSGTVLKSFSQGSGGYYYNPPTLVSKYLYIGTCRKLYSDPANDNYFFKLDHTLNKVWEYSLGNKEVRGGATLDSAGNIYFVVEEGRLYGDTSNSILYLYSLDNYGNKNWSRQITSSVYHMGMSNPAISVNDAIYIGGDKFYAFDTDGNELWSEPYGNNMTIMNAPIIDPDGNIYFSAQGSVISLNQNGQERWTFDTSGEFLSSPAFSQDYSKIFVAVGNKVFCLGASEGVQLWEFPPPGMEVGGTFRATPAVDDNDNVYIGTKDGLNSVFYAINADGSNILWEQLIGADLYSSPALGNDNTVYVGSEYSAGNRLHALDMTTGDIKWSATLDADVVWSSPAISNAGILYVAAMVEDNTTGTVYAFKADPSGLLPDAGSPRFHEGNASTGRRE